MSLKANESWVVPELWEKVNPIWRDRILVILEDLAQVGGLAWAAVLDEKGNLLTRIIGADGPLNEPKAMPSPVRFVCLTQSLTAAWTAVREREPSHIVEELDGRIVITGIVADLVIVAGFDPDVSRGAVVMRMTKRIKHLRSLQKSRERGALYV